MRCPNCNYDAVPPGARFCPNCGQALSGSPAPSHRVTIDQQVGAIDSGEVVGLKLGKIEGNVTVVVNNPTPELLAGFKTLHSVPTAVLPPGTRPLEDRVTPDQITRIEAPVQELLQQVRAIERRGQPVDGVEVGGVRVSRVELLLKQAVLLKADADQLYLDTVARNRGGLQGQGATVQVDLAALLGGFDERAHTARLKEAHALLQEAHELDPTNAKVLLHMAQVAGELNPDDERQVQALLYKAIRLLDPPRDDREKFWLAQAIFLSAMAGDQPHPDMLRDARNRFAQLGEMAWVEHIDLLLSSGAPTAPFHAGSGPGAGQQDSFQPAGQWHIQASTGSVAQMAFYPNGRAAGMIQMGPFGGMGSLQAQWRYDPASRQLQIQGALNGIVPVLMLIAIQDEQYYRATGLGSDGVGYVFTRVG